MKHFEEAKLNRKDYRNIEVLATIVRILLLPILVWYRLYLWVYDGTMFKWNREIFNSSNDGGQKGVKVMRNNNDPWVTLYEALDVIYNPSQEAMSKKYVFGKALDEGLITYIAYKRIRDHFVEDGSWDYWSQEIKSLGTNCSEALVFYIFDRSIEMFLTIVRLAGSIAIGIVLNWFVNHLRNKERIEN